MSINLMITHVCSGDDEDKVFERIVTSIKECSAYAEKKKVLIGLHNHNHGQIPATGDMVVKLLEAVDSPNFVGLLDSGQWYGSPGIGAGSMAYGKPDGEHGTPRGELDPEYDYLDSIKTAANSGKLVQVTVVCVCSRSLSFTEWIDTVSVVGLPTCRYARRSIVSQVAKRNGLTTTKSYRFSRSVSRTLPSTAAGPLLEPNRQRSGLWSMTTGNVMNCRRCDAGRGL